MASKIACKTNLTEAQKNNVAKAFISLLKGLTLVLSNAIQCAHNNQYPEGPKRNEFHKEFWRNLFLDGKMLRKDIVDKNGAIIKPHDGLPEMCPPNPYDKLDIQILLKYLYYGGKRLLSGNWRDNTAVYCSDQDIFFDFFNINYFYDAERHLNAKDFSYCLNFLLDLRNGCFHETKDFIAGFVLSERKEDNSKEQPIYCYVDRYKAFLIQLCKKEWHGRNEAIVLFNVALTKIYDALGEIQYRLDDIVKELNLFSIDKDDLEQLLVASGLKVENDNLFYQGDIDELMSAIKIAWKSAKNFSFEDGLNLLKKLIVVLKEDTKKNLEELGKLTGSVIVDNSSLKSDYDKLSFEDCKKMAEGGDAEAQYRLGLCYLDGKGTEFDSDKAYIFFKKSANQGNSDAMVKMGWFYERGVVVKHDLKKAFEWYKKAADLDNADGNYHVGLCYENQIGVEFDRKTALLYYKTAAQSGHENAEVGMGRCYLYNDRPNKEKAKEIFERLATKNNSAAKCGLGMYYENEHLLRAIWYYRIAKNEGDETASVRLQFINERAIGVMTNVNVTKRSSNEVKILFEHDISLQHRLLEQNYPPAIYVEAKEKEKRGEEGEHLLIRAADSGYLPAIFKLCDIYLRGQSRMESLKYKDFEKFSKFSNAFTFALRLEYPPAMFFEFIQRGKQDRNMLFKAFYGGSHEAQNWLIKDVEDKFYPTPDERTECLFKKLFYASKCGNIDAYLKLLEEYQKEEYWNLVEPEQLVRLSLLFSDDDEVNFRIAEMYYFGVGKIEQDLSKAIDYYKKASIYPIAMIRLAGFYECGEGVEIDKLQALALYEKAAELGNDEAKRKFGEIKDKLNSQELDTFEQRFHLWNWLLRTQGIIKNTENEE